MNLLQQAVRIILKYSNPERIYLYGSHATGDAVPGSDIDLAFEDKDCKEISVIQNELNELNTLIKIEVKNLAFTENRFQARVKSSGKVIYSANKKLRAEDGLYNFSRALEKLLDVVTKADLFGKEGLGDIYLDVVVKRFEFTYEMSWKAIKRYLDFVGILCNNPRSCFKEAFAQGLITDENIWLEMIEQRNLSSHIYSELEISGILKRIDDYAAAFSGLRESLEKNIEE